MAKTKVNCPWCGAHVEIYPKVDELFLSGHKPSAMTVENYGQICPMSHVGIEVAKELTWLRRDRFEVDMPNVLPIRVVVVVYDTPEKLSGYEYKFEFKDRERTLKAVWYQRMSRPTRRHNFNRDEYYVSHLRNENRFGMLEAMPQVPPVVIEKARECFLNALKVE